MSSVRPRKGASAKAAASTNKNRRSFYLYGSLALVAIVIVVAISLASRPPAPPNVGEKAPEFAIATTAGLFDLAKNDGKPTLLEVFASWCPHCQRETKVLDALYPLYKDKINFVAVSGNATGMDQQPESQADVLAFATKFNVLYPIAFDPTLDVATKYAVQGYPTFVLVGSDGTIDAKTSGEVPKADIVKTLNTIVASGKPDPAFGFSPPE